MPRQRTRVYTVETKTIVQLNTLRTTRWAHENMAGKRHGYIPVEMAVFEKMTPQERIRAILANKAPDDQRFASKFIEEQCQLRDAFYDMCTSTALLAMGSRDFWINAGVSRTLNVTFLRPAPEGEDCLLLCEIVSMGKSLSLLKGVITREKDGAIISMCEHDKAAVTSKPGWKI